MFLPSNKLYSIGSSLRLPAQSGSPFKLLKEGCDGENLDGLNSLQAEEIVVAAHEPSDAGGHRAGNELGIVRVA